MRFTFLWSWAALFLVGLSTASADEPTKVSQRWGVLIGVDDYAYANDLDFCGADQHALFDQLKKSGFPADNIFLLHSKATDAREQPTRVNIERQLNLVFQLAEAKDLLFVGFSGHGVHIDGKSYLCPADAVLEDPKTLISLDDVYDRLNKCAAPFKIVLVDACRNDPSPGGKRSFEANDGTKALAQSLQKLELPEGVVLLNSCAAGEISWEEKQFGHGVFMHYVLEALAGAADTTGDRFVSLNELSEYVGPKTKAYVARKFGYPQRPFFKGDLSTQALSFALFPIPGGVAGPTNVVNVTPNTTPLPSGEGLDDNPGLPRRPTPTDAPVSNSIGMKFRVLPPGEFLMGAAETDEAASADEKPQHRVQITRSFAIGVYEVTVGQYRQFVNATQHVTVPERLGTGAQGWVGGANPMAGRPQFNWRNWWPNQTDEHPVINIAWEDAVAFCNWLTRVEGKKYRLPTEAEWEYACRAGSTTRFPRSDDETSLQDTDNVADAAAKQFNLGGTYASWDDANAMTSTVGRYQPNAFGLYDMNGNVREFCSDWYSPSYYAASPSIDPPGAAQGESHAVRGGGWLSYPLQCRSTRRFHMVPPMQVNTNVGFRVVREVQ